MPRGGDGEEEAASLCDYVMGGLKQVRGVVS